MGKADSIIGLSISEIQNVFHLKLFIKIKKVCILLEGFKRKDIYMYVFMCIQTTRAYDLFDCHEIAKILHKATNNNEQCMNMCII